MNKLWFLNCIITTIPVVLLHHQHPLDSALQAHSWSCPTSSKNTIPRIDTHKDFLIQKLFNQRWNFLCHLFWTLKSNTAVSYNMGNKPWTIQINLQKNCRHMTSGLVKLNFLGFHEMYISNWQWWTELSCYYTTVEVDEPDQEFIYGWCQLGFPHL